jgi:DNA-binding winged helix-turn-helix (wHTH) protein
MQITATAQSDFSKTGQEHHEISRLKMPGDGKDIAMRTLTTSHSTPNLAELALVTARPRPSQARTAHVPNPPTRHRSFVRNTQKPPTLRKDVAELLANIDGMPVLVRFIVTDMSARVDPDFISEDADFHSLLSSALEKMVDRIRGSSLRRDDPSQQAFATVELMASAEHLPRLPALSNDTVLRVGPLELDLLDRTAKRGERRIDLRPREFQLLKFMMQRSDTLLTRATLLKEVWNYKFVPKTNLVDVHMGRLRRKIDEPNESPLIRNVRGVGFVLGASPISHCSAPDPSE